MLVGELLGAAVKSISRALRALHPRGCQFWYPVHPHLPHYPPLTSLEAGLEHVRGDCHSPVEDPCDAPSHQDPRHTELTDTAEYQPQPQSDKGCEQGIQTIPPLADGAVTRRERLARGRRSKARAPVT